MPIHRVLIGLAALRGVLCIGPERDDEIAVDTLDHLSLAGARFDWLQRRLKAV